MYNVDPFELIISEAFMQLGDENIHRVIGFEMTTGEELILFRGTLGECKNFIHSVEATALAQLRHYHQLMDKFVDLDREFDRMKDELNEQEEAYDRLLVDYNKLDHNYQYVVAKNEEMSAHIDRGLLLKIATGKTSRCDAVRLLVDLFGMDFDKAYQYVNIVLSKD
jgi:hypothetical protein